MSLEIDKRDPRAYRDVQSRQPERSSFAEGLTAPTGFFVERAAEHARSSGDVLGLAAGQPPEFKADPHVQQTTSGMAVVHLQQEYKSIPIFQAAQTVRFAPSGALVDMNGKTVAVGGELALVVRVPVTQAVLAAAQHVVTPDPDAACVDSFGQSFAPATVDLTGFEPCVLGTFSNLAQRPTMLAAGPFGDSIKASLTWLPLPAGLCLCWEVTLTMPQREGQYRVMVDAQSGDVVYCSQLVLTIAALGNVFRLHGGASREMTPFPRPLADYALPIPGDLPHDFPYDWVEKDAAIGNCVAVSLGGGAGTAAGAPGDAAVIFDPPDPDGDDQKLLNLFYYVCFMHDYFYLLGFREEDGNFQQDNFGRAGTQGDRVDARAHRGAVFATANMITPVDGAAPVMNMGLVTSTNRHTALDCTVVFHEFTHGVTSRLVGGPLSNHALESPQSAAMSEGWGDYIACTVTGSTAIGAWVIANPAGIRGLRYDSHFEDHFGLLGTGRYTIKHTAGEIWCAALLEVNRRIGATLAVQLVVDALKLSSANPSFLQMRDAILAALEAKRAGAQIEEPAYAKALKGIWGAFARYGMGAAARSNGNELRDNVADFTLPPAVAAIPDPPVDEPPSPAAVPVELTRAIPAPEDDPGAASPAPTTA